MEQVLDLKLGAQMVLVVQSELLHPVIEAYGTMALVKFLHFNAGSMASRSVSGGYNSWAQWNDIVADCNFKPKESTIKVVMHC